MNRKWLFLAFLACSLTLKGQPWKVHGKLMVSGSNPHYLQYEDGTPFFWFADTGWELLKRLSREETIYYLENRRQKGFNIIQTVLISEFIHMDKVTNYYDDSLFVNENPLLPEITSGNNPENSEEYDYWDHLDYVISAARDKGLYTALVPSWGEWVVPRVDKPLFNTREQAYNYGWFLGSRYGSFPNIIWIFGGDRHPDERPEGIELWRAMAEGVADGTNGIKHPDGKADFSSTLMTHHSFNSSSTWFHGDEWIDFHTWGSYHDRFDNIRAYTLALADFNLADPKPTINSEPCYEQHGVNYAIEDNSAFSSTDVRMSAYWTIFSGGAGYTYGAHPVWQFTDSARRPHSRITMHTWRQGLEFPGAIQVNYLRQLMLSREFANLVPDASLLVQEERPGWLHQAAIRGKSFMMAYTPMGEPLEVRLGIFSGKKVKAWWFDPRKGTSQLIGEFENSGIKKFEVPGMSKELAWLRSGRGCDWVLVLDDASSTFPEPGK
jgi:hypothetical protein